MAKLRETRLEDLLSRVMVWASGVAFKSEEGEKLIADIDKALAEPWPCCHSREEECRHLSCGYKGYYHRKHPDGRCASASALREGQEGKEPKSDSAGASTPGETAK